MFAFDENGVCRAYLQFAQGKWYSGSTSGHLHDRTYVQRILCITDEADVARAIFDREVERGGFRVAA